MILAFRRWLARLLLGASEYDSGIGSIGYAGSAGALAGIIRKSVEPEMPLAILWSVGVRWVSDLPPGEIRIVIEAPR